MSKAWVEEPGRMRTAEPMLAASGVETANCVFQVMLVGALLMVGRVARLPSELNKYAGE